ncbi:citrate synthase [bacterium]|nr:citrate synthase [bacterium]MDB4125764.1 citrate synthase [Candidatus Neomarinimicrobiota bacterium]
MKKAKLIIDEKTIELPIVEGSEHEKAIDITSLRKETGYITLDPGYGNTGACLSDITFIDGEKGILRYRGFAIEDLVKNTTFTDLSHLLIYGDVENNDALLNFKKRLRKHAIIHEDMKRFFDGFPPNAHPMAILSSMVTALSSYYQDSNESSIEIIDTNIVRILAKVKTIAAYSYRKSHGLPFIYPEANLGYVENFLHMMFADSQEEYHSDPIFIEALNLLLILHADHEQNCSTSTVRMVGSSHANIYATISAGISALWGPLHGGANQAVIEMLKVIHKDGNNYKKYIDMAKDKNSSFKLMGFGHRVYKNYDPRAKVIKNMAEKILTKLNVQDPLLDIAKELESVAINDEYFIKRGLYPNVDFYSGIIYRAMGFPTNMFTVLFALGRLPGWLSHWREMILNPGTRINRPRQIYTGITRRDCK